MENKRYTALQEAIFNHGENLRDLCSFPKSVDMVNVCKKLFSMENKARGIFSHYECGLMDKDSLEYAKEKLHNTAVKNLRITHASDIAKNLLICIDPKAYIFRIHYGYIEKNSIEIFKDSIGNGILAPDFRFLVKG
jgi:hypothetical protein